MKRERSKGDYNEKYSEYADNDEDGGMPKEKKKKTSQTKKRNKQSLGKKETDKSSFHSFSAMDKYI